MAIALALVIVLAALLCPPHSEPAQWIRTEPAPDVQTTTPGFAIYDRRE